MLTAVSINISEVVLTLRCGEIGHLIDRYGRRLLNARLAVTLRCNYRCFFCHSEGIESRTQELTPSEWGLIATALRFVGVESFKFTGGEPLVRDDIVDIVREVNNCGKPLDLSMTTNGYYLKELAGMLRDVGLGRLNISLHSLRENVYKKITGCGDLSKVLKGIYEALNYDYRKIKLNVVVIKGVNDGEVWDIIDFAARHGLHVQLIELHPVGRGKHEFEKYHSTLDNIVREIEEVSSKIVVRGELHNRPIYYLPTGITVEVVKPVLNPLFCAACSRIRVAPDGALKPCLSSNTSISVIDIIKSNMDEDAKIRALIERIKQVNAARKPSILWPISMCLEREYMKLRKHVQRSLCYRVELI